MTFVLHLSPRCFPSDTRAGSVAPQSLSPGLAPLPGCTRSPWPIPSVGFTNQASPSVSRLGRQRPCPPSRSHSSRGFSAHRRTICPNRFPRRTIDGWIKNSATVMSWRPSLAKWICAASVSSMVPQGDVRGKGGANWDRRAAGVSGAIDRPLRYSYRVAV
jgi:hypothetical protein